MNKVNRILFPTDFSEVAENAFRHAVVWATKYQADIHVINVFNLPIGEYGYTGNVVVETIEEVDTEIKVKLKKFVEKGIAQVVVESTFDFFPNVTSSIESGTPENAICHKAEESNFDLIIMGTRGEGHDFWDKVFGTVSHYVVENSKIPVLLIPPKTTYRTITKVVYAADLTATQPFRIWQTYELLKEFRPNFHCVHVRTDKDTRDLQLYELDNYFKAAHPSMPVQFHLVHLDSIEDGMRFAINLWNAELLCMYTPHHSLFRQLFSQSNSHNAIDYMNIPLLFLKA